MKHIHSVQTVSAYPIDLERFRQLTDPLKRVQTR